MSFVKTHIVAALLVSLTPTVLAGCAPEQPIVSWEEPAAPCRVYADRIEVGGETEPRPGPLAHGISAESLELLGRDAEETHLAKVFLLVAGAEFCRERHAEKPILERPPPVEPRDPYTPEFVKSMVMPCGQRQPLDLTPSTAPGLEEIGFGRYRITAEDLSREGVSRQGGFIAPDTFESLLRDAKRAPLATGRWADVSFFTAPCIPYQLVWVSEEAGEAPQPVPLSSASFERSGVAAELLRTILRRSRGAAHSYW